MVHRQRCESGDHGRGARSAGTRQDPPAPLTSQSAKRRSAEISREVPTDHEAPSVQEREHSDEASHVSAGCVPGSRGDSVQAPSQRSYGLISPVLRARRGPRCTVAGADRRLRCRRLRQILQLAGVPGDARKDQTRHDGTHDHAKKTGRSPMPRTRRHGREEQHRSFHTRSLRGDEEPLLRRGALPSTLSTWRGVRHVLEEQRTTYSTWTSNQTLCSNAEPPLLSESEYPFAAQCAEGREKAARARAAPYVDDDSDSSQA